MADVPARTMALIAGLLLLASACRGTLVRSGSPPTPAPTRTVDVGSRVALDEEAGDDQVGQDDGPGDVAAGPGEGFVLVLIDQNGNHPAGIPVAVDGPKTATITSDDRGRVTVDGPPGFYTFKVPVRCYERLDVRAGGSGRFGIAEGQHAEAEVEVIWRHRHGPAPPVFSSIGPYWPIGETVRLRYDVVDHCRNDFRATETMLETYAFEHSGNLELVGEPDMRSDTNGYAWVEIRCTEPGPASLVLVDAKNPEDKLDLIEADNQSVQRPRCGQP